MTGPGLVEAANRLLDGHGARSGRSGAVALRAALVDLYEFWLHRAAAAAGVGTEGVALAAVGGLGRRELVPFSDVDLVLLHTGRRDLGGLAEAVWYPLWDSGVGVDHSVRTPDEALAVAAEDVRTAVGLLDLRHIAGDGALTARVREAVREQWRRLARRALPELASSARRRWERAGEIAQSAQPDLKHGRGGLRDVGLLDALAAAQLADRPSQEVTEARRLLLDVRTELRRNLRRDRDLLDPSQAEVVADQLGLADRFALARALSGASRAVAYAVDVALRVATRLPGTASRRVPPRTPVDDGVVLHGAEVALARGARPARDASLVLRVAAASATTSAPIAQGTLTALAESSPEPRTPWPAAARDTLTRLLGAGEGLVPAVEALDRAGLWGRLLPEWGAVRDLPPREPVHTWTVDRHLVRTCVEAARLTTTVSRPDLLLLAALLHDIGKGRDTDHSELGARITARVAQRLGLSSRDGALLAAVVRHHLLLPHTATRRDIGERATVRRVVDTLDGDVTLLELLHALTEADARATGPGVWTAWRARLVGELVARCRALMRGEPHAAPERFTPAQRELAADAVRVGAGRARVRTVQGAPTDNAADADPAEVLTTVEFAVPRGASLLAPATGVLALNSMRVLSAVVREHGGGVVGVLTASPVFGGPPDPTLLRDQFARAVAGRLDLRARLAEKERAYAGVAATPRAAVLWFDDEAADDAVVLELRAVARIGLLHRVARALDEHGARVRWAKAAELGGGVVDSFAVSPSRGAPDAAWRARLERAVLEAALAAVPRGG
ncbi:[protein-PII] uridylyltransferase [Saccharomonospora piscinae]|uniref:[protein-PII] uridylyltransferase n=1 Tax=Saccharomonospora piscinae TaxID=687388 RepID=UPI001106DB16|nr:[protein-PII] uridylyltransferase [Saccharomonospora piscinae]TLW90911.1 [protein-PII] uridylyltransferase [Saccharomonospora piscinae]